MGNPLPIFFDARGAVRTAEPRYLQPVELCRIGVAIELQKEAESKAERKTSKRVQGAMVPRCRRLGTCTLHLAKGRGEPSRAEARHSDAIRPVHQE